MAHMSAREWSQFAASRGLDPQTGKKTQPDFEPESVSMRLIPLTQVRLYVVAAWRRIAPRFSSDCLA